MKKIAVFAATLAAAWSAQGADKVTFDDHVLPIFRNACLNCHNPDKKKAGLDLSTYQATLQGSENGKVLQSGNAGASLLFKCVKQTEEPRMPPKGDKLSDAELAVVEKWIAGQLLENATGKAVAAASNNVQVAAVSLERPAGPPPMPGDLPIEPYVRTVGKNALTALAVSPWAPVVAIGGQRQVLLYNTETLAPLGVLPFPEGLPQVVRFSRNGQLLLTGGGLGGKSGKVALWDIKTGDRIATLGNEFDQVLGADISANQQFVALGGPTKLLKIYATKDGKLLHSIKKHTDWVTAVVYSPDGKYLASGDRSGGIQIWEGASGKEFNTLAGHKAMVTALAFMPGVLASSSEEGKITLWDAKEGKELRSWNAHNGGVAWVDFTPDGRLVSCGRDRIAKVWDQNGQALGQTPPLSDIALRAALATDRVIVGDWNGLIRVSKLDGQVVGELTANPPSIAERVVATTKQLSDAQAGQTATQQQVAAADAKVKAAQAAAEEKRKADLAAAQKAQDDAQKAIEAAKAQTAAVEKAAADAKAENAALQTAQAAAKQAADASAKIAAEKKAASAPDLAAAEQDAATKTATSAEAGKKIEAQQAKIAAADAAAQKAKAELPKTIDTLEKTVADARKLVAEFSQTERVPKVDEALVAAAKKKLDDLNADVVRRREARAKLAPASPEYKAAGDTIEALKPQLTKADQELAEAKKPRIIPFAGEAELAKAQAALPAFAAQIAAAKADLERWKAAQVLQASHNARQALGAKQALFEQLTQKAKDAPLAIEKAQSDLANAQKTVAEGPVKIQEKEKLFATARQAVDAAKQTLAAAEKAQPEKVAAAKAAAEAAPPVGDVAGLTRKIEEQNAELVKLKTARDALTANSPEYNEANTKFQALKAEIPKTQTALTAASVKNLEAPTVKAAQAEVEKAAETLDETKRALKTALQNAAGAEKALAQMKKDVDAAALLAAKLDKEMPQIVKNAETQKAQAEEAAAAAAREVEAAKAEAEKRRADYETLKGGGTKAAALTVPPSKS